MQRSEYANLIIWTKHQGMPEQHPIFGNCKANKIGVLDLLETPLVDVDSVSIRKERSIKLYLSNLKTTALVLL